MAADRDDQEDFETISPAEVPLARNQGEAAQQPTPAWYQRRSGWLLIAALIVLTVLVLWLPGQLRPDLERIASGDTDPTAEDQREARTQGSGDDVGEGLEEIHPDVPPPFHERQLARAREQVEDLISELLDLQETLEAKGIEHWGASAFEAALARARAGDDAFVERQYDAARTAYEDAVMRLQVLRERAPQVLAAAIAQGRQALTDERPERALEQFNLALAIDPDATDARRGYDRAERLPEVLQALEQAETAFAAGELQAAANAVDTALALDSATERAQRLREQIRTAQRDRDYQNALSRGYGALGSQALETAATAFNEALRLRPQSADAREGLTLVQQTSTTLQIETLRDEAETAMAAESWQQAADRYEAALDLDRTLRFAQQGLARARYNAELEERIDDTLANPERLSEDPLLADAEALLLEARSQSELPPVMARRVDALADLLARAAQPVAVILRSDGATQVTVLRVARLGTFEETVLKLRPGRYTATGSRVGYRDVRKDFSVQPDDNDPVVIQTEEPI